MIDETLDVIDNLIRDVWVFRCAARLADAQKSITRLNSIFTYFHTHLCPPSRLEARFQVLYLQVQRLNAVGALEQKDYPSALAIFQSMSEQASRTNNAAIKAIALTELGKEIERKGDKQQAVTLLEDARDYALSSSKLTLAFTHSYLARVYAGNTDTLRFERAIDTGLKLATSLDGNENDKDEVVYAWSPVSSLLAEKSWGYLDLHHPRKTLDMKKDIAEAIQNGQDSRIFAWIPLDYARAYKMIGEIENCIAELRTYYERVSLMQSPHAELQVSRMIHALEKDGYANVAEVKDFKEEMHYKNSSHI